MGEWVGSRMNRIYILYLATCTLEIDLESMLAS